MSQIYFSKFPSQSPLNERACLKIINQRGDELSIAGDDSCGAMKEIGRLSAAHFSKGGNQMKKPEEPVLSGECLLELLANHLGYKITRK